MSKEKQIEEMAKLLMKKSYGYGMECSSNCDYCVKCRQYRHAEIIYDAGYRKQSGWISVEERLPDCEYGAETEALLFRLKTGTVEAGYFGTGGRFRDKYFRCYHHANEGWDAKDVTHWMPLPEPPQMKGGE